MSDFPSFAWGDPVNRDNREEQPTPVLCPFSVVIDTREQAPWSFTGFKADSNKKYRPLVVNTETRTLPTGDYSIYGMEADICIERKSPSDAFSTFTADRERFERELERMAAMRWSAVVIECGWDQILAGPQRMERSEKHSEVIGKTVYRSILAWSQRYPMVHWFPMPTRLAAERTAFRLLERWWIDRKEEEKQAEKASKKEPV